MAISILAFQGPCLHPWMTAWMLSRHLSLPAPTGDSVASPNYRGHGSEAEQCPYKLNLLVILLGTLVQTIKKKSP